MAAYSVRGLGAALALIGLAGCAIVAEVPGGVDIVPMFPGSDPARLMPVGSTWSVSAIAETALPADNGMVMRRETRVNLTGTTACNSFSARMVRRSGRVAIEDLAMTEMACIGYPAQHEAALAGALSRVDGIAPGRDGGIVLTGGGTGLVALAPVLAPPPAPKAAQE